MVLGGRGRYQCSNLSSDDGLTEAEAEQEPMVALSSTRLFKVGQSGVYFTRAGTLWILGQEGKRLVWTQLKRFCVPDWGGSSKCKRRWWGLST